MDKFYKKTKIVATLGPATSTYESIKALMLNGANVFRLNTSHGTIEDHQEKFDLVRKISRDLKIHTAIMVDLQGPKIRVGTLEKEYEVKDGETVVFEAMKQESASRCDGDGRGERSVTGTTEVTHIIPVDYDGIANDVGAGARMLIDDGRIEVEVSKVEGSKVYAKVINGGILKSRKGLNIPGCTASLNAVTERDIQFVEFAVKNGADYVALSFVRQKDDVLMAKKYIKDFGGSIPVISKIEKPQAIENLCEIIAVSEYVMVARGDLGIELSPVEVPICQKNIIQEANRQRKGVIVATQMLETMITEPIPTRAEASDIANAIIDGADAVMLSAETSVGAFAPQAVKMMSKIAHAIENSGFYKHNAELEISDQFALTRQAVVFGADRMVSFVNARAIITFSHNGYSARLLSKLKPSVPVIVISDLEKTCQELALNWGIFPAMRVWDEVMDEALLKKLDDFLVDEYGLKKEEYVIIVGSTPYLISGRTNFIRVHRIGAEAEA